MASKPDYYSEITADLQGWRKEMIAYAMDAITDEHGRAPFEPATTRAEKEAYYTDMLYRPDGTPNAEGRAALMAQLGPDAFLAVVRMAEKNRLTEARKAEVR